MQLLQGFKVRGKPEIFHIFYMDDCLSVAHASSRDAITLLAILNAYIAYFGQSINTSKSHFMFSLGGLDIR